MSMGGANAAPTDDSEALGQVISTDLLALDLLDVASARAGFPSDPDARAAALNLASPDLLGLQLGLGSLQLPLLSDGVTPGLLNLGQLGVLNSYASTPSATNAVAAAGAVDANGAIALNNPDGTPRGNASINLTSLLSQAGLDPVTSPVVRQLSLEVGALGSNASKQSATVASQYTVADAKLNINSPAVGTLTTSLGTVIDNTGIALNGAAGTNSPLLGTISGILGSLNVAGIGLSNTTIGLNGVDTALNGVKTNLITKNVSDPNGIANINLGTGIVSIDLDKAFDATKGLNGQVENTDVINAATLSAITVALGQAVDDLTATVTQEIRNALNSVRLVVNATVEAGVVGGTATINASLGQLLGTDPTAPTVDISLTGLGAGLIETTLRTALTLTALPLIRTAVGVAVNPVLNGLGTLVSGATTPLLVGLTPVINTVLANVVQLTVNDQPTRDVPARPAALGAGSFSVSALTLTLLPNLLTGLNIAKVSLGTSSIRALDALPAATLTVNPESVPAGTPTNASGANWTPNQLVTVQLIDGAGAPTGAPITSTPGTNGLLNVNLPVASGTTPGNYTVRATNATQNATDGLTVTAPAPAAATLAVNPETVVAGVSTTATGTNWIAGVPVSVQLVDAADNNIGDPIAFTPATGGALSVVVPVPAGAAPGDYTVEASSATQSAFDVLAVTPASATLAVNPESVVAGTSTTATGANWIAGVPVSVQLVNAADINVGAPVTFTPALDGALNVQVPVPAGAAQGSYTIKATSATQTASDALAVTAATATLAVNPDSVVAGASTTATGTNWISGVPVSVQLVDALGSNVGAPVATTPALNGALSVAVPVPGGVAAGDYTVKATSATQTASDALTVTVEAATLAVNPETVVAGGSVTAAGANWLAGIPVSLQLVDAAKNNIGGPISFTPAINGVVSVVVPVPAGAAAGVYTVEAKSATQAASDTFAVTVATATLAVTPETVVAGNPVTAAGTNWIAGAPVSLQLVDAADNKIGGPISFTPAIEGVLNVVVPVPAGAAPGVYTVEATSATQAAADTFTVSAAEETLVVAPKTVAAGNSVTAEGTNWIAGVPVSLQVVDAAKNKIGVPTSFTPALDGRLDVVVPVPAGVLAGNYTVEATSTTQAASDTFAVTQTTATLVVNPETVAAGSSVTATGANWIAGVPVSLQLVDAANTNVGAPVLFTPAIDGVLNVAFPVAGGAAAGNYTVKATTATQNASDALAVTPGTATIAVNPASVVAGTSTTATGTNWLAGAPVSLQLVDAANNNIGAPVLFTPAIDGGLNVAVPVPAGAAPGSYKVKASSTTQAAETNLTVTVATATLAVDPESVVAGTPTTATGTNWIAGAQVAVQLIDARNNLIGVPVLFTPALNGQLTAVVPVPAGAAPGDYTVRASNGTQTVSDALVVRPAAETLTVNPETIVAGNSVTATGTNWVAGVQVSVQLVNSSDAAVGAPVLFTPTLTGGLNVQVPVPAGARAGAYTVAATSTTQNAADALAVEQADETLVVSPGTVAAGGAVTATGTNWIAGLPVSVQLVNAADAPVGDPVLFTPAVDGLLAAVVPVPAGALAGGYSVVASNGTQSAEAALTVTQATATFSVAPKSVVAGTSTNATGANWITGRAVTLQLVDAANNKIGAAVEITPALNGALTAVVPVPAGAAAGSYIVQASNGTQTASDALTVEQAVATLAVNPESVAAGTPTTVTGTNWTAGVPVSVQLVNGAGANVGGPVSATPALNGVLDVQLPVPGGAAAGNYTVTARSLTQTASDALVVTPATATVAVNPETVVAGGSTTATGSGWLAGVPVSVQLVRGANVNVGPAITITPGIDGAVNVQVPVPGGAIAGSYTVVATSDTQTASDALAVTQATAALAVNPETVATGASTTATGSGWIAAVPVSVQLVRDANINVGPAVIITPGLDGVLTAVVPVPAGAVAGAYTVVATSATQSAADALAVTQATATLAVDPETVVAGDSVTVDGTNWIVELPVAVQIEDADGNVIAGPVTDTPGIDGVLTVDVTVPAGAAAGEYTVVAGNGTQNAETGLTVTQATATLAVDPETVVAGGSVTVDGTNWIADLPVTVQIEDADGNVIAGPVTTTPGIDGVLTVEVPVPAGAAAGEYAVVANNGTQNAEAALAVTQATANVAVNPETVVAGGSVTATGGNWIAGVPVSVQLVDAEGADIGDPVTFTPTIDGGLTAVVPVPAGAAPGAYTVEAASATQSADADLAVTQATASLAVDPKTVVAGDSVTATGTNWTVGAPVSLQLVDAEGNDIGDPITFTPDFDGALSVEVPVPAGAAPGAYTVEAASDTQNADADLAVTQAAETFAVNPESVVAGGSVTAAGTNWIAGLPVTVQLVDAEGNDVGAPVSVTPGLDGELTAVVPVPAGASAGEYTVTASNGTQNAEAGLAVTQATATLVVDPESVVAGGSVTVTGTNWIDGLPVTVQLVDAEGNNIGAPVTYTPGEDGALTAEVPVPAGAAAGGYTVTANNGTQNAEAELAVTQAAVTLVVDPESVVAGGSVTVTGTNWIANQPVTVQLVDAEGSDIGDPITFTPGLDGALSVEVPVPAGAVPGNYTVTAGNGTQNAVAALAVTQAVASLVANPESVRAGTSTTASGANWTAGVPVSLQLVDAEGESIGAPVAFTPALEGALSVAVPVPGSATPGDYTIAASSATQTAEAALEVTDNGIDGNFELVPEVVVVGEDTTVVGGGYTPGGTVTIVITDPAGNDTELAGDLPINGDGGFEYGIGTGDLPPGIYPVTVTDNATGEKTTKYLVINAPALPQVQVDVTPKSVAQGNATLLTGRSFTANNSATVQIAPIGAAAKLATLTANQAIGSDGTFELRVQSTDLSVGDYQLIVTDNATGAADTVTFTVTAGGNLASTGAQAVGLLVGAGSLLLLGAAAMLLVRRRRSA